ncbi:MAG TPA: TIGR03792 family protein [Acidimicrobiales bacterium]|nr:TIGR03792 family protein [Acidimicrobiales bacterium]
MIVEELTLDVDDGDIEAFLDADARVWTAFLSRQAGFVRKEVWLPHDRPGSVVIMVWWESREMWKAITDEQVAAVDARMGEWFREPAVREYRVVS